MDAELEKQGLEVRHGGPELRLKEGQIMELFASYKEQFVRQQAEGLTDRDILDWLNYVLKDPTTVLLFSEAGDVVGMGGIRYYETNTLYPNDSIVELGTLIVAHPFRGRGHSETILKLLKTEALQREPKNRGIIFTLITANPIVKSQAVKAGYKETSSSKWVELVRADPKKEAYLDRFDYRPYVNEDSSFQNKVGVQSVLRGLHARLKSIF